MKQMLLVLLIAAAAPAVCTAAEPKVLAPQEKRITDEAIAADRKYLNAVQQRLAELNKNGVPVASYHFAKAQAWLDFAVDTYAENDRTSVVDEALAESLVIIKALEKGDKNISMDTPIIGQSMKVRNDLWERVAAFKAHPNFRCAEGTVAQLEVQLVWAGHEEKEMGWRHSKPYLQAAERLARKAQEEIDACANVAQKCPEPVCPKCPEPVTVIAPVPAPAAPKPLVPETQAQSAAKASLPEVTPLPLVTAPVPAAAPVPAPVFIPEPRQPDLYASLPDRIHFAVDDVTVSGLSAIALDRIASAMQLNPAMTVEVQGHADIRGNKDHNKRLSKRRADNTKAYLVGAGIAPGRITVRYFDHSRPLTKGSSVEDFAFNRRVEFVYSGTTDMGVEFHNTDVQVESPGRNGTKRR